MNIDKKWLIYGGVGAIALVAGYYYFLSPSQQPVDTGTASGGQAFPDLTFAAAPLGSGGGSPAGTSGTDALSSLIDAFSGNNAQSLAQINAQQAEAQTQAGVSVFTSLLTFLNAHKGLNRISAVVPQVGTVTIGPQPKTITKTVTKTTGAILNFKKGAATVQSSSLNSGRITNLLNRGFKPS